MALRFPVPQRYGDCHCVSRLLLRQGAGFLGVTLGRVVVVREITVTLDGEEFARDVALVLDMLAATEHLADISGGPSLGARPGALMPREPLDLAPRDGARWPGGDLRSASRLDGAQASTPGRPAATTRPAAFIGQPGRGCPMKRLLRPGVSLRRQMMRFR